MIPVVFVWRDKNNDKYIRRHATLPAIPAVGARVIPPAEETSLNVRAHEWDCSRSNGGQAIIHIALD